MSSHEFIAIPAVDQQSVLNLEPTPRLRQRNFKYYRRKGELLLYQVALGVGGGGIA